jgi:hypothetical protein
MNDLFGSLTNPVEKLKIGTILYFRVDVLMCCRCV